MNSRDKSKICILIVPERKKVKRVSIPHWLPKATMVSLFISFILLLTYIISTNTYNSHLLKDSSEKEFIIYSLKEENQNKSKKLLNLKSQTNKLREKTLEVNLS